MSERTLLHLTADRDEFFRAVQAELDAGRDPIHRADLIAWLEQHSTALEEFASLRALHLTLAEAPAPSLMPAISTPQARVLPWRAVTMLASAAALLLLITLPDWMRAVNEQTEVQGEDQTTNRTLNQTVNHDPNLGQVSAGSANAQVLAVRHMVREEQTNIQRSHQTAGNAVILSLKTSTRRVVQ